MDIEGKTVKKFPKRSAPTDRCVCWGCGEDRKENLMGCGTLCYDCLYEEHLAAMAHTGLMEDTPHPNTPECCLVSRIMYRDAVDRYLSEEGF